MARFCASARGIPACSSWYDSARREYATSTRFLAFSCFSRRMRDRSWLSQRPAKMIGPSIARAIKIRNLLFRLIGVWSALGNYIGRTGKGLSRPWRGSEWQIQRPNQLLKDSAGHMVLGWRRPSRPAIKLAEKIGFSLRGTSAAEAATDNRP